MSQEATTISKKKTTKKIIGEVVAIAVCALISLLPVPEGLTRNALITLGILAWAVINWIFNCMDDFIVAILMCVLWALFKTVPFATAFNGFSSTTWWILIGALGLGTAVNKSGLLKRVSLYALRLFPPTFKGQVMAMLGAGTIAAPLIPSTTAKCAITAPIAMGIADQLGLPKQSQGRTGLYCAMYTGFSLTGTIFISASFLGYTILGVLPQEVQSQFHWLKWFVCMIPWAVVLLVGSYFFITRAYRPETNEKLPPDMIKNQIAQLGKMSREEKITTVVLAVCLVFWIGESYLGISSTISTLVAMGLLFAFGVLDKKDFQNKMLWGLMFFIGSVMGLGSVLDGVGVTAWLGDTFGPFLTQFASNPYLLVLSVTLAIYLLRMVITSLTASMTIFTVILIPIAQAAGINPWVVGIISYVSVMVWYFRYMNANYLSAFAAAGGDEQVRYGDTAKMSFGYMAISLVGLLVSVPYWQLLGLIP